MNVFSSELKSFLGLSKVVSLCIIIVLLQACGGSESALQTDAEAFEEAVTLELDLCDAQEGVPEIVEYPEHSEVMCHLEDEKKPICYAICKPGAINCPQLPCGDQGKGE